MTPDKRRTIFGEGHATHQQLKELKKDLGELLNEVAAGLTATARRLEEARLRFPARPWQMDIIS
jgi:hypothetical protein